MSYSILLLIYFLRHLVEGSFSWESIQHHSQTAEVIYPVDGLISPGNLYPLGGKLPSERSLNSLTIVGNYAIVYGGISPEGSLLDDIHLYDYRFQQWSNPILRRYCCDDLGNIIETLGFEAQDLHPPMGMKAKQSDIPLARAEHMACSVEDKLYVFGGVTLDYGYSQDFYSFDPNLLLWKKLSYSFGAMPRRRAAASILALSDAGTFYLFGGRTGLNTNFLVQPDLVVGMNDLWSFDVHTLSWLYIQPSTDFAPSPRQYASITQFAGKIYIFGGINPASNVTYDDVWSFDIGIKNWSKLSSNTGNTNGHSSFSPPPMYNARMVPLVNAYFNKKMNISETLTDDAHEGFFVYAGISGEAACASRFCTPSTLQLGRIFAFSTLINQWIDPPMENYLLPIDPTFNITFTNN